jgi:hypothetical protein
MRINMLLALGALMMFATFLGASNRVMIGNSQLSSQNEYYIAALSYGQSVIEEAKTKDFQGTVKAGGVLAPSPIIGIESDEERIGYVDVLTGNGYASGQKFDDVDDYNGYVRKVNSPRAEGYMLLTTVNWVDESDPGLVSATPTKCKRMVVNVTSPYFPKGERNGMPWPDTLKLSFVFSR